MVQDLGGRVFAFADGEIDAEIQHRPDELRASQDLWSAVTTTSVAGKLRARKSIYDQPLATPDEYADAQPWGPTSSGAVFTYNPDGSVNTKTMGALVLTYSYNPDGSVDTISDGVHTKTFAYDGSGNLLTISLT